MAQIWARQFYNSKEWIKCKKAYAQSVNNLCEMCLERGRIEPGYIVHHKKKLTPSNINDVSITLSWDNLQFVCLDCHNNIHMGGASPLRDDVMFDEFGNLIKR